MEKQILEDHNLTWPEMHCYGFISKASYAYLELSQSQGRNRHGTKESRFDTQVLMKERNHENLES